MIKLNNTICNDNVFIYRYIPRKGIINVGKYTIDATIWITFGIIIRKIIKKQDMIIYCVSKVVNTIIYRSDDRRIYIEQFSIEKYGYMRRYIKDKSSICRLSGFNIIKRKY